MKRKLTWAGRVPRFDCGQGPYPAKRRGERMNPILKSTAKPAVSVFGITGETTPIDRDYFTFMVPDGLELSATILLPGTQTPGIRGESFIGVEAGSETAAGATGLLGWFRYDTADIGTNILPLMGGAGLGAAGFAPPLPSGSYSFWVQEASAGTVAYGLDFTIATPEPVYWPMLLAGLALLGARILRGEKDANAPQANISRLGVRGL